MKTIGTVSSVIFAVAAGSAAIELATGLPFMFALCMIGSLLALAFAATVVIGALVSPPREPLSVGDRRRVQRARAAA